MGDPGVFRCESEPWYMQSRQESLMIAVNCTRPGGTCFCASWGTGPKATEGFDLALTELHDGFVVEVGSKRGAMLVEKMPIREPSGAELELADLKLERAREHMGRQLDTAGLKEFLDQSGEFPEWGEVAQRCLSCGNCTMVCPTCFCCTVNDTTDLTGTKITRTRQWESCFTHEFTYTHTGPERNTIRGRYRHWMRHKLCTWWGSVRHKRLCWMRTMHHLVSGGHRYYRGSQAFARGKSGASARRQDSGKRGLA